MVLSLPVVLYCREILLSGDKIIPGDYSYYLTQYEAIRRSIFEFHQFPWWNPWVAGGTPLFGNIQAGLISIDTFMTLIFGTVDGFKVARLAYLLIGFWGLRTLFVHYFKTEALRATLLAYIWTFGSFLAIRITGHNTFLLIELVPWIIFFYLRLREGKNWLWFSLLTSLLVFSSPHYIALQLIVFLGLLFVFEGLRFAINKRRVDISFTIDSQKALNLVKAGGIIILLCAFRLYYVLEFIKDYPRPAGQLVEGSVGLWGGIQSLFISDRWNPWTPPSYSFGWAEAVAYIGAATGVALLIVLVVLHRKKWKLSQVFNTSPWVLLALGAATFILAMGNTPGPSPYEVLRSLPAFDSMRVAARWLAWSALMALVLLAAYKARPFRKTINLLLIVSCVELFVTNSVIFSDYYSITPRQVRPESSQFEQAYKWETKPAFFGEDENLYEGIKNNYGQLIASDSLVFTAAHIPTSHCGFNQGCSFVSGPAELKYWSPNKIELRRTSSGPIVLNMNPGRWWQVNDQYIFAGLRVTDTTHEFVINDPSETIVVEYVPKYSIEHVIEKIQQKF